MLKKILISLAGGVLLTVMTNHVVVRTEQRDVEERVKVTCIQAPCADAVVTKSVTVHKRGFPLVTREGATETDVTYSWAGRLVNVTFYGGLVFLGLVGVKRLRSANPGH